MALINPYIHFNGNAEEAFTFYKSVFGGEFAKVMRYKELASTEHPIAEMIRIGLCTLPYQLAKAMC